MDAAGTAVQTITEATSPPVTIEAPSMQVDPPGDCVSMTLRGRPDQLTIPVRGIVQYSEDGNDLFWGPAVVLPSEDSLGAGPADSDADSLERYTFAGGRQLVQDSVVIAYLLIDTATDVASIAEELCTRYAHPALTVATANFPATSQQLATFYKPECQLSDALDELAKTVSAGAKWWVDASGAIHFEGS